MCMMLYIASDRELPLIRWEDKADQYLCVNELNDSNISVKKQFTKKYIYYIGSYQGCGCGFRYGYYVPEGDDLPDILISGFIEEEGKRKESVKQLFDYIRDNAEETGEVELYSCWAGNEDGMPEHKISIQLRDFTLRERFNFEENQFISIKL